MPSSPAPRTAVLYAAFVATLPSMAGKTVAITGCTSGTGLVLARTCGQLGARVVMVNRPSQRADSALTALAGQGIDAVHVPCDLQSFQSVRAAAVRLKDACARGVDVLCNNAGVMGLPDRATRDGYDVQMQSNHLSHFLLTSQIWPLLEAAADARGEARVVNHSSGPAGASRLTRRTFRQTAAIWAGTGSREWANGGATSSRNWPTCCLGLSAKLSM